MSQNAYALYFAVVLIGCAMALHRMFHDDRDTILLALAGASPDRSQSPNAPVHFRARPRWDAFFPRVVFSISRL